MGATKANPAFYTNDDLARDVIERTAAACGKTSDKLMDDAASYLERGWQIMDHSELYKNWDDWSGFWKAYHTVRKLSMSDNFDEYAPYTCSC